MCIATIWNSFKPSAQISKLTRLTIVLAMVIISTFIAVVGEHTFLSAFKSFILFLLTFFIPWSAINLVDYYFISKEECDVNALY
ncbi:cytosine permease, partial [Klebsiella pneumoniae]|nr:cytosine permease [Klebsiella pneumoniae]